MGRRGGMEVTKGRYLFVTEYVGAWNVACDDLAKNAVCHDCPPKK
jgi:hypothetical protein